MREAELPAEADQRSERKRVLAEKAERLGVNLNSEIASQINGEESWCAGIPTQALPRLH